MTTPVSFDLSDLTESDLTEVAESEPVESCEAELNEWAETALNRPAHYPPAVFFDIETGGRPDDELRQLFHEKPLEEFAATCDKRWKSDTVAAKYEEYKTSAWEEFVGRAALSPATGRVLLIGTMRNGAFNGIGSGDEITDLGAFWEGVEMTLADKTPLIGHNSNGFDLPFLVRRSWLLGMPVPREIRQGRYWHPLFRDTMEHWACGGREFVSLTDLGELFGLGGKTAGLTGADFARFWFGTPDEHALAVEYNRRDLELTAAIAAKMGMI